MSKLKRYVVVMDFYLYAESDEDAIKKAEKKAEAQRKKFDNQAKVLEIHETPFATFSSRKIK